MSVAAELELDSEVTDFTTLVGVSLDSESWCTAYVVPATAKTAAPATLAINGFCEKKTFYERYLSLKQLTV